MGKWKTKFRNKLQLSNSLRPKTTRTDVDVNAVINSNQKQAHQSQHASLREIDRVFSKNYIQ
jgi:hypothetical protein